jgi:hypothetical protein
LELTAAPPTQKDNAEKSGRDILHGMPRNSSELAMHYDREKQKGNAKRATLAVARKLVAYLMAVDRGQRNFQVVETSNCIAA